MSVGFCCIVIIILNYLLFGSGRGLDFEIGLILNICNNGKTISIYKEYFIDNLEWGRANDLGYLKRISQFHKYFNDLLVNQHSVYMCRI